MKKLIKRWLGINSLEDRFELEREALNKFYYKIEDKINAMAKANMSQALECRIGELEESMSFHRKRERQLTDNLFEFLEKADKINDHFHDKVKVIEELEKKINV